MKPSPHLEYQQSPNIQIEKQIPTGKRFLIIGEAEEGKMFQPTLISTFPLARSIFKEGPLLERYQELIKQEYDLDVYLMRIPPFAFEEAFFYLRSYYFDIIYVDDFQFGSSIESILAFIEYAKNQEEKGRLVHGIFDEKPIQTFSDYEELFELIQTFTFQTIMDIEEEGKYFSIVADQFQEAKAGMIYASLLVSLNPEVSPLNKSLKNITLKREFTKEQIFQLQEAGIVCFRNSYHHGVVCASDTCAVNTPQSVYKHIPNYRIIQALIYDIYMQADQLIGETGIKAHARQLTKHLNILFQDYKDAKRLKDYEYTISYDQQKKHIYVSIDIVPIFSIYHIQTKAQVRVFQ